jgi:hypothetical protein
MDEANLGIDPIIRLSKDLKSAASSLSPPEARLLVDYYYIIQKQRVRANNQITAMEEEPHDLIAWIHDNTSIIERNIKSALQAYALSHEVGQWSLSIHGIGPVISAGLLAHIDLEKTTSVSKLWSFAGLNPDAKWGKGQKRPHNARLKVICYHIGECFKRCSGSPKSFYGPIYSERKQLEVSRNDAGDFEDQAKQTLSDKRIGKQTDAYKWYSNGQLPPARLDLRACRYAAKLFLSHWWQVAYEIKYGKAPPRPWILTQEPHTQIVAVPNWPKAS